MFDMFIAWKWYYRVALCDMSRLEFSLGKMYYFLFYISILRARAALCIISLSVRGPHEIAPRAAVGPRAAGCRPL